MSVRIMAAVWDHGPDSGTERLVMLALADFCDDEGVCFPSMARIGVKSCMTERGARNVIRRLESDGWISVEEGGGRHGCNRYTLHLDRAENPEPRSAPEPRSPGTWRHKTRNVATQNPERGDTKPGTLVPPNHHRSIIDPSKDPSPRASARECDFDDAFSAWPNRGFRDRARTEWQRATRRASPAEILDAVKRQAPAMRGREPRYVPLLATWLRDGGWENDTEPARRFEMDWDAYDAKVVRIGK